VKILYASMKNIFLAAAFAVATLTGCAHKPAPVAPDAKVVKTPAKACPKAKAAKKAQ